MVLSREDKSCKPGEKGWVFVYELAIHNTAPIRTQYNQLAPGYWESIFIEGLPTVTKNRMILNDLDKSHDWQIGGTTSTPNSKTCDGTFTSFNVPLVKRFIEYPGGTPRYVFDETGPLYIWLEYSNDYGSINNRCKVSSPNEILDYRFIFCPQEDEEEWIVGDCDCPDKTKQQPANQDSPYQSEWSDRSWVDSDAGARGFCKHEYASYKYVGKPQPQPPLPESEV